MSHSINKNETRGIIGFFADEKSLLTAAKKVRGANYKCFDAFTPYPVHGLDAAMGLKRSWLPYVTFVMGLTGSAVAFGFQYFTSAIHWTVNVGGKPFNSWPAFVPVMFEVTVLFAGVSTFLAMLFACRIPNTTRKIYDASITSDQFALVIENPRFGVDEGEAEEVEEGFTKFEDQSAQNLMQQVGAQRVRKVHHEGWFDA